MRYLLLLLLAGCGTSVVGPELDDQSIIDSEWAIAQADISKLHSDAYNVRSSSFNWRKEPDAFDCWGVLANGCFDDDTRTVTWNAKTPGVIRHEAGHAILWKLHDPNWACYEHGC